MGNENLTSKNFEGRSTYNPNLSSKRDKEEISDRLKQVEERKKENEKSIESEEKDDEDPPIILSATDFDSNLDFTPSVVGDTGDKIFNENAFFEFKVSRSLKMMEYNKGFDVVVRLGTKSKPKDEKNEKNIAFAIVMDVSGSMQGNPIQHARDAAKQILQNFLKEGDYFILVTFSRKARVVVSEKIGKEHHNLKIIGKIDRVNAGGSTNMMLGLTTCFSEIKSLDYDTKMMVVLSDGVVNDGEKDSKRIAANVRMFNTKDGVKTNVIGLGSSYDEELLKRVSRAGHGEYMYAKTSVTIGECFGTMFTLGNASLFEDVKIETSAKPNKVTNWNNVYYDDSRKLLVTFDVPERNYEETVLSMCLHFKYMGKLYTYEQNVLANDFEVDESIVNALKVIRLVTNERRDLLMKHLSDGQFEEAKKLLEYHKKILEPHSGLYEEVGILMEGSLDDLDSIERRQVEVVRKNQSKLQGIQTFNVCTFSKPSYENMLKLNGRVHLKVLPKKGVDFSPWSDLDCDCGGRIRVIIRCNKGCEIMATIGNTQGQHKLDVSKFKLEIKTGKKKIKKFILNSPKDHEWIKGIVLETSDEVMIEKIEHSFNQLSRK